MNQQNQYDFILNGDQPPKKSRLGSGSLKQRLAIAVAGLAALIILMTIFTSILGSQQSAALDALKQAALQQHELIRVSEIGIDKARGQEAKNIAITTKLSLQSQQADMLSAVEAAGQKLSSKDLAAGKNTQIDSVLVTAEQNNAFDAAFLEAMSNGLSQYQRTVAEAYDKVTTESLKAALQTQYESANTLVGATSTD